MLGEFWSEVEWCAHRRPYRGWAVFANVRFGRAREQEREERRKGSWGVSKYKHFRPPFRILQDLLFLDLACLTLASSNPLWLLHSHLFPSPWNVFLPWLDDQNLLPTLSPGEGTAVALGSLPWHLAAILLSSWIWITVFADLTSELWTFRRSDRRDHGLQPQMRSCG